MVDLLYIPVGKTVRIRSDFQEQPNRIELPRNKRGAMIVLALISIWGAVGTVGLFHGLARLSTNTELSSLWSLGMAFIITFIAIVIGILAMRQYVINDTILLFEDHVELTSYTLLRKNSWSAPLSEFDGIKMRETSVGEDANKKTYQIIELIHKNKDRRLPIYLEKGTRPPLDQLHDYADQLKLSALLDSPA